MDEDCIGAGPLSCGVAQAARADITATTKAFQARAQVAFVTVETCADGLCQPGYACSVKLSVCQPPRPQAQATHTVVRRRFGNGPSSSHRDVMAHPPGEESGASADSTPSRTGGITAAAATDTQTRSSRGNPSDSTSTLGYPPLLQSNSQDTDLRGLSNGAVVGIAVSLFIGGVIITTALVFTRRFWAPTLQQMMRRHSYRKRSNRPNELEPTEVTPVQTNPNPPKPPVLYVELEGTVRGSELDSTPPPAEFESPNEVLGVAVAPSTPNRPRSLSLLRVSAVECDLELGTWDGGVPPSEERDG